MKGSQIDRVMREHEALIYELFGAECERRAKTNSKKENDKNGKHDQE